MSISISISITY